VLEAAKAGQLRVDFLDAPLALGSNAEITFKGSDQNSPYMAYRVEVFFDAKTQLPTRMTLINWQNETTGIYSYEDLKINLGNEDPSSKKNLIVASINSSTISSNQLVARQTVSFYAHQIYP